MNARITIRNWAVAASFGLAICAGVLGQPVEAHAATADDHPDFLWAPVRVSTGSRLFVGGLSGNIGQSEVEFYFKPTEMTVDKPVP